MPPEVQAAVIDASESYDLGPFNLSMTFIRHPRGARVGCLRLEAHPQLLAAGSDGESALLELITALADQYPIFDGDVTINLRPGDDVNPPRLPPGRDRLWIALMAREIGDLLGGRDALVATNLFSSVEQARTGGYVLKTSPHADDLPPAAGSYEAEHWWRSFQRERAEGGTRFLADPDD
nr:hypothetical protein GCM10020063_107410 [Dactylosporangium thailandense]